MKTGDRVKFRDDIIETARDEAAEQRQFVQRHPRTVPAHERYRLPAGWVARAPASPEEAHAFLLKVLRLANKVGIVEQLLPAGHVLVKFGSTSLAINSTELAAAPKR